MDGHIFADVQTTLGHVGNLPFSGCLDDRLKAKVSKVNNNAESDKHSSDPEQGVPREEPALTPAA